MTRLFFQTGRIRLRMTLVVLLCLLCFGLVNISAYWGFFSLQSAQLLSQIKIFAVVLSLLFCLLTGFVWTYLRPVAALLARLREEGIATPESADDEAARSAALRFPLTFAALALVASAVGVAVGLAFDVWVSGFTFPFAVTLAFATLTEAAAVCAFVYVIARSMMRPIIAHFRHEDVPSGIRVGLRSKVSYSIISLCLAASIPTALFFSGREALILEESGRLTDSHIAESIAYGATFLGPEALGQATAAIHLSGGRRILFTDDGAGEASPLPPDHKRAFVKVSGSTSPRSSPKALVVLIVLLLGFSAFIGRNLGDNLSHDVRLVSNQLRALAEAGQAARQQITPLVAEVPQFSDLRRLADAVNDLLDRFTEIAVTQFLAIEKTHEADRVKTQFLANVSHDLRSPLNSVLGFSELLLRLSKDELNERQRAQIETINRCGGLLLLLINEVLDTAKVQAGRVSLNREDALPAELLSKALQEVQRRGVPDPVQLETELQAGMQAIMVDPFRLIQAMTMIINYCVESMEQGRIIVQLRLRKLTDAGGGAGGEGEGEGRRALRLRVATTSGGLVESEVKRIFAGFRRKPGQRGLGLGLPLAKAFIEMHDGTLQLTSTPRIGTTFTAEIPIIQPKVLARLRPRR